MFQKKSNLLPPVDKSSFISKPIIKDKIGIKIKIIIFDFFYRSKTFICNVFSLDFNITY